ncbi:aspartoacylase [Photobacterium aquimaris]|uniref:aspartoacylase n=1 Tax=Photobacterium aquimaris TaxID=512643 RepID=UPI000CF53CDA|nr:aspartoacylase [Photobacterium aquimaris]MCP4955430.1 aspartoacylase [Photobacterium aquimaris]PQJ38848.1 aspartoacylase [Photobacterium aquimaris]
MSKIKTVAVVGGTHGNEFSGIYLLRKWQQSAALARDSFSVETVFANPKAHNDNKRYIDHDLNRQFSLADLTNNELASYEQSRAKAINQQIGPKGDAKVDFIIDLHNTTSNMGPSLILLQSDRFNRQLGAYVKMHMPNAVIVLEDHTSVEQHHFLSSIAPQGVIVEIGPQPQSVIRQDVLDWMDEMTQHILDFVHLYNTDELLPLIPSYEAFRYHETLSLPLDEQGQRIGMVHRSVQDNDFEPLHSGDPIFTLFDGSEVFWKGDYEAFPHFINEAAYYDNNLAMSLAKKVVITTQD